MYSVPTQPLTHLPSWLMDWTPEQIRALRKRLGYTQARMARALGYSRIASISELENGHMEPSETVRVLLCHIDQRGDLPDCGEA